VLLPEPGEDLRELVEKSARGCPSHAIAVESR
jgi:ferredoxin